MAEPSYLTKVPDIGAPADLGQNLNIQAPVIAKPPTAQESVTGPFGSKGTLGSILGTLGDIVLVNSGLKPVYQPKVQAAKEADAIDGFDADPMAAMQRLARVAGAGKAEEFYDNYLLGRQRTAQTAQAQAAAGKSRLDASVTAAEAPLKIAQEGTKVRATAYSIASAVKPGANRGTIQAAWDAAHRYMGQYNIQDDDPLPDISKLSDSDAQAAMNDWAMHGTDPDKQAAISQGKQRIAISQQNADTASANSAISARNVDSQIGARGEALQIQRNNSSMNSGRLALQRKLADAEIRKKDFEIAHPTKSRGGAAASSDAPPPISPASYKGKTIVSPGGTHWTSDGNNWNK